MIIVRAEKRAKPGLGKLLWGFDLAAGVGVCGCAVPAGTPQGWEVMLISGQTTPVIYLQAEGVIHQVIAIKGVTFEGGRVLFSVDCAKNSSKVESRLGAVLRWLWKRKLSCFWHYPAQAVTLGKFFWFVPYAMAHSLSLGDEEGGS